MRKYQPRIHLIKFYPNLVEKLLTTQQVGADIADVTTYIFSETGFTTVTAYQNQQITKLKIERNPFAKGGHLFYKKTTLIVIGLYTSNCPF